jgi:hypothetical protein
MLAGRFTQSGWYRMAAPLLVALIFASACGGAAQPTATAELTEVAPAAQPMAGEATAQPTAEPTAGGAAVQSTAEPTAGEVPPATDLQAFQTELIGALTATPRDYDALQTFMGDEFEIMIWRGNGEQMSPVVAAQQLKDVFLPPANVLTYSLDTEDMTTRMGVDPFEFYRGFAAGFVLTSGWGDGSDEALLVIAQNPDGQYYWSGILLAWGGFASTAPVESAP